MQSAHASQLFQTSSSLATGKRRAAKASGSAAKAGRPIYLGKKQDDAEELRVGGAGSDAGREKVLDAVVKGETCWTAESGGVVRGTNLRTGKTTHLFLAHKAPVCALAFVGDDVLASAGWDKTIHFWSTKAATQRPAPLASISSASEDFIKALHYLPKQRLLLSGGSDRCVRAWHVGADLKTRSAGALTGAHTRGVTSIASFASNSATIYTADSMGRILEVQLHEGDRVRFEVLRELRGPETSVAQLVAYEEEVEQEEEEEEEEAGPSSTAQPRRRNAYIWAASNDKTAQRFDVISALKKPVDPPRHGRSSNTGALLGKLPPLAPSVVLRHPDYVKAVLPIPAPIVAAATGVAGGEEQSAAVMTGSADEDLRVWSIADEERVTRRQRGHWHEVEKLALWHGVVEEGEVEPAAWYIISTGLDGSIRRWKLEELMVEGELEDEVEDETDDATADGPGKGGSGMTAEEEAELAELMSDDDE